MKYSKDGLCAFDPTSHTYRIGDRVLPGVTGIISRFKNKFDADEVAAKYAKKNGLIKEDVLADWDRRGRESREAGTTVHALIEDFFVNGEVPCFGAGGKLAAAVQMIQDLFITDRLQAVACEEVVHNGAIASQIDLVAKDREGNLYILDWKTNSTISDNGWGRMMMPPFDYLPDAPFYHYSLQLSFYKELWKESPLAGAYIVHIKENAYDFIKPFNIKIPKQIIQNEYSNPTH